MNTEQLSLRYHLSPVPSSQTLPSPTDRLSLPERSGFHPVTCWRGPSSNLFCFKSHSSSSFSLGSSSFTDSRRPFLTLLCTSSRSLDKSLSSSVPPHTHLQDEATNGAHLTRLLRTFKDTGPMRRGTQCLASSYCQKNHSSLHYPLTPTLCGEPSPPYYRASFPPTAFPKCGLHCIC